MDVIYIPRSPIPHIQEGRARLLQEFVDGGWKLTGTVTVKDPLGAEVTVWILVRG